MMQDSFLHRDQPWECEGLDPFRDDPVGTNSDFEYNDIHGDKSDDENGEDGDQGGPVYVWQLCAHAECGGKIVLQGASGLAKRV